MNFVYIIGVLAELFAIVHSLKTGRAQPWIFVILFLPGIGSLAYIIIEVLPGLSLDKAFSGLLRSFESPQSRIEKLEKDLPYNQTVVHKVALAEAYTESGEVKKAIPLYESCLVGISAEDPAIHEKLISAYLQAKIPDKAGKRIEALKKIRGGQLKPGELLLEAEYLEAEGEEVKAEDIYKRSVIAFPGMEADYRYCAFLAKHNQKSKLSKEIERARRKFDGMFREYKSMERQWMQKIEQIV
jgi:hypothetical protein